MKDPNTSHNIWFQGGGFATIWAYGVAEELKRSGIKIKCAGGYSAGASVASYLLTPRELHSVIVEKVCMENKWSPYRSTFGMLGHAGELMKNLHEVILGDPLEFTPESYNGKLWVPIRGLSSLRGSWRNSWRDYDDLIETFVSTTCFPGMHGEFPTCYYDDVGHRRGKAIDGGLFSLTPPPSWCKKSTIIVSPWGSGDLNMHPPARILDIAFPSRSNLKIHFNLGMKQAREYFSEARGRIEEGEDP
jgi:hypothetical protein